MRVASWVTPRKGVRAVMRRWQGLSSVLGMALALLLARCSNLEGQADKESAAPSDRGEPGVGGGSNAGVEGADDQGSEPTQPEVELEATFRSPVATGKYVWAANPASDRVALVDAAALTVRSVEAGNGPTYLAAVPATDDTNRALVINVEGGDASLLTATETEVTEQRCALHPDANAWAVGPQGGWAIAWTDVRTYGAADPMQGFQDVTVIRLPAVDSDDEVEAYRLNVGYRPSRVFIRDDEHQAFVVTEVGITVIELEDTPTVSQDIYLASSGARDTSVTPDGRFALVRREGDDRSAQIDILEIASGEVSSVLLSGNVTDLDLIADGSRAIAVVRAAVSTAAAAVGSGGRGGAAAATSEDGGAAGASGASAAGAAGAFSEGGASNRGGTMAAAGVLTEGGAKSPGGAAGALATGGAAGGQAGQGIVGSAGNAGAGPGQIPALISEVAILQLPEAFEDAGSVDVIEISDARVGSVSASIQGDRALLFTNAWPSEDLVILNTAPGDHYLEWRVQSASGAIQAVFPTPDAAHALALLTPGADSTRAGAFSVVSLDRVRPAQIRGTQAAPMDVVMADTRGLVTVRDDTTAQYGAYLVRMPELQIDEVPLARPPLAAGIVPAAGKAFVAQEHPEGQMTFIDLAAETDDPNLVRTLIGFELATRVVGDAGDRQ